jgi:hypothetical protein
MELPDISAKASLRKFFSDGSAALLETVEEANLIH